MYGPALYVKTHKQRYLLLTFLTTFILIFLLVKMKQEKYSFMTMALYGKVFPTLFLALIGFFVVKDKKITFLNLLGLVLLLVGIWMVQVF